MAATTGAQFSNISATTTPFALLSGKYGLDISATWGGGNAQLQMLSFDGSTWVNVGSAITVNGYATYDLAPGQYRFAIANLIKAGQARVRFRTATF
jgi:hypothetical protein